MKHIIPIIILLLCFISSCKTRYITQEVPIEIHDTINKVSIQSRTDTLWRLDSISIVDTIWIDTSTIATLGMPILRHNRTTIAQKSQGKVSVQTKVDTLIQVKEMPKIINHTEYKEIEKPLYWWQKALMWLGGLSFWILFTIFIYKLKK